MLTCTVQEVLDVILKMALSIPLADIISYSKLGKAYFGLVEVLCNSHTETIASRDTATFQYLLLSLDAGLKSLDLAVSTLCATAIDNLAGYYFKAVNSDEPPTPTTQVLPSLHFSYNRGFYPSIVLFEQHKTLSLVPCSPLQAILNRPESCSIWLDSVMICDASSRQRRRWIYPKWLSCGGRCHLETLKRGCGLKNACEGTFPNHWQVDQFTYVVWRRTDWAFKLGMSCQQLKYTLSPRHAKQFSVCHAYTCES